MITEKQISCAVSLEELGKLVSECERCTLYKSKTKDVFGVGNTNAEIFFIGEAPGKKEDLTGEPFVGAAGKFLNEMLESINISRSDVYIANTLKHRPPENRDPKKEEAEACWPYLRRQIEIVNPKLIVFLGRHSMNRFFPELKISEVHGNVFEADILGIKCHCLALYHPAAALYNGGMRETLKNDFSKIPQILQTIK